LIELGAVFEHCRNVLSRVAIEEDTPWDRKAAICVFHEAVAIAGTTLSYLPGTPYDSSFKFYNPLSVAAQTRVLVDIYLTISYLLEEKSPEMSEFQELVWQQQAATAMLSMIKQANPDHEKIDEMEADVALGRKAISDHPLASSLTAEDLNNCVCGLSFGKIYKRHELVERLGLDKSTHWPLNAHTSQYIHASALAANQLEAMHVHPEEGRPFVWTLVRTLVGVFCLNALSFHVGMGIELVHVGPGVYHTMTFWRDFYMGAYLDEDDSEPDGDGTPAT
jgi:hypothetical protein